MNAPPKDLWGPIEVATWRTVPSIAGRRAVELDVKEGRAVFFQQGQDVVMEAVPMALPQTAILRGEDGTTDAVVVIQVERAAHQVLVGYRILGGGNGIATMSELEFVENPDAAFWSSAVQ